MNRVCLILLTALIATCTGMLPLYSGCSSVTGETASNSKASLSEATMCKDFDSVSGPSNKTSVFSKNDFRIICSVKVSDAPAGTMLKAVWQYSNSTREQAYEVRGTGYYRFELDKKTASYATGDHSVKLYLNGQEIVTLPFKIE